jgi:hypothetical protein
MITYYDKGLEYQLDIQFSSGPEDFTWFLLLFVRDYSDNITRFQFGAYNRELIHAFTKMISMRDKLSNDYGVHLPDTFTKRGFFTSSVVPKVIKEVHEELPEGPQRQALLDNIDSVKRLSTYVQ